MAIHPTAEVDKTAIIADSAEIDRNAYVGPHCVIGENVKIGMNAIVECHTEIGDRTILAPNAHVGGAPQDYSFKNEDGSEYQTKLLYKAKVSGKPIIEEAYKKFYVNTCNGYELEFIVPNVNYKINDVFELSEIDQLLKENSYINSDDDYIYYANVYFPSFFIEGNYELIDFFKEPLSLF